MKVFGLLLSLGVLLGAGAAASAQMSYGGAGGAGGSGGSAGGGFTGGGGGGSSFGSSGGSGSSGGGFTGSTGTFSGSSGGGASGGFTGSTTSASRGMSAAGSGASSSTLNTANPLYRFYGNPLVAGLPTAASSNSTQLLRAYPDPLSFGVPLYGTTTAGRTGIGGGVGGGSGTGTAAISSNAFRGANSFGAPRAPVYLAELAFEVPPRVPAAVRADLETVLARSSRLPSRERIRVVMDGATVVLRGEVASDRERRLAESVVRLSPGVRTVRNDLAVTPATAAQAP